MTKQQLRDIVKQDNARRAARISMEDAILGIDQVDINSDCYKIAENTKPGSYVNPCLVRGIGTVNPPLPTSASRNQWDANMRRHTTVGVAPGTEDTATHATVLVYKDGVAEIVPASHFRKTKTYKRSTPQVAQHHVTSADLPAIQDYSA